MKVVLKRLPSFVTNHHVKYIKSFSSGERADRFHISLQVLLPVSSPFLPHCEKYQIVNIESELFFKRWCEWKIYIDIFNSRKIIIVNSFMLLELQTAVQLIDLYKQWMTEPMHSISLISDQILYINIYRMHVFSCACGCMCVMSGYFCIGLLKKQLWTLRRFVM